MQLGFTGSCDPAGWVQMLNRGMFYWQSTGNLLFLKPSIEISGFLQPFTIFYKKLKIFFHTYVGKSLIWAILCRCFKTPPFQRQPHHFGYLPPFLKIPETHPSPFSRQNFQANLNFIAEANIFQYLSIHTYNIYIIYAYIIYACMYIYISLFFSYTNSKRSTVAKKLKHLDHIK